LAARPLARAQQGGDKTPFAIEHDDRLEAVIAAMGGFVDNYMRQRTTTPAPDPFSVMHYFTPDQVPVISQLARAFGVSDRWHASAPCQTWPNRFFVHTGPANGYVNNSPTHFPYQMKTVFNRLAEAGQNWRVYFHDIPQSATLALPSNQNNGARRGAVASDPLREGAREMADNPIILLPPVREPLDQTAVGALELLSLASGAIIARLAAIGRWRAARLENRTRPAVARSCGADRRSPSAHHRLAAPCCRA